VYSSGDSRRVVSSQDVEVLEDGKGLILKVPKGRRYRGLDSLYPPAPLLSLLPDNGFNLDDSLWSQHVSSF
jgi:hypothetical protein